MGTNLVYLLTRKGGDHKPSKYIGSKTECSVGTLDGETLMYSERDNKVYYSSCKQDRFLKDLQDYGFDVVILESNILRDELLNIEEKYQREFDAVDSEDYYNLCYAAKLDHLGMSSKLKDTICNPFGEKLSQFAASKSRVSRLDSFAVKEGFKDFADKYIQLTEFRKKCANYAEVSRAFGYERHAAQRFVDSFGDVEDSMPDDRELAKDISKLLFRGASLPRACDILCISFVYGRLLLGDSYYASSIRDNLALLNGYKTTDSLEREVLKQWLLRDEGSLKSLASDFCTSTSTIRRIVHKQVRLFIDTGEL